MNPVCYLMATTGACTAVPLGPITSHFFASDCLTLPVCLQQWRRPAPKLRYGQPGAPNDSDTESMVPPQLLENALQTLARLAI